MPVPYISFDDTEVAFAHHSDLALLKAYFLFSTMHRPALVKAGTKFTIWAMQWHLPLSPILRRTIYEQFCGGETLQTTATTVNKLSQYNLGSILDYGVEAKEKEREFDKTTQELLRTIQFAQSRSDVPAVSCKLTGLAKFSLLEAVHKGLSLSEKQKKSYERLRQRLHTISKAAHDAGISVYYDAEESWIQNPLDQLINEMMLEFNREKPIVFNTFQLYRHDRLAYLQQCHAEARSKGYILGAKLVRGAYMEKERERANKLGYESPIQADKVATDADFNAALLYCVENIGDIAFCCASHNEASNIYLTELLQKHQIANNHNHVWFAQLYGMSDHISYNMANADYNVAKYLPYGPVKEVVPYLMRRAQENTSVSGQTNRELSLITAELKRRKPKSWWRWLPL
jgi:proline dehydrogenase